MADYAVLSEVKAQLDKTKTALDTTISALITAASRAIDDYTRRPDGYVALTTAAARTYQGQGHPHLRIDECVAITEVAVKDAMDDTAYIAWAATDWQAFHGSHRNPDFNHTPYTGLFVTPNGDYGDFTDGRVMVHGRVAYVAPTVRVTAKWGYAATAPEAIKQACIIQVARWWRRGLAGFGDAVGNADLGLVLYTKELDPEIKSLLFLGGWMKVTV